MDEDQSSAVRDPYQIVSPPSPATTQCSETISSAEGGSEPTIVPDSFIQEVLHECVSRFMLFCLFITSIAIYPRYGCCRLAFVLSFDMSNTTRYPPGVKTVFPVPFPNKLTHVFFFSLWCVSCDFLLIVRALLIHRRRWVEWVVEVVVNRHHLRRPLFGENPNETLRSDKRCDFFKSQIYLFSLDTDLVLHRLREGFRAHSWTCWQSSNRRDAVLCQDFAYDETRCANASKASQTTSHAFAIITGGSVSNASFHRSDDDGQRRCPHCHVISSLHHEFWECPRVPNAATRPAIPECILQQRLGWPSHDKKSETILAWQVSVRKHQLNSRQCRMLLCDFLFQLPSLNTT